MNDVAFAMVTVVAFVLGILWLAMAMFLDKKGREGRALIAICYFLIAILVSR